MVYIRKMRSIADIRGVLPDHNSLPIFSGKSFPIFIRELPVHHSQMRYLRLAEGLGGLTHYCLRLQGLA